MKPMTNLVGEYQCEECGTRTDDPKHTETRQGYRETVVLAWCADCWGGYL